MVDAVLRRLNIVLLCCAAVLCCCAVLCCVLMWLCAGVGWAVGLLLWYNAKLFVSYEPARPQALPRRPRERVHRASARSVTALGQQPDDHAASGGGFGGGWRDGRVDGHHHRRRDGDGCRWAVVPLADTLSRSWATPQCGIPGLSSVCLSTKSFCLCVLCAQTQTGVATDSDVTGNSAVDGWRGPERAVNDRRAGGRRLVCAAAENTLRNPLCTRTAAAAPPA